MANLRFSPGFMKQISSFGSDLFAQDPSDPRMGGGGMAGMLTRSVGGLAGRDMRTGQEKITQGMAEIAPDDPQRMAKMYGLMIEHGKPEQKIAAMGKMQELGQQRQAKEQQERYRQSLITTADQLGLGDLTAQITNASSDELRDFGKELYKRQIEMASRGDDDKASLAYLQGFGIDAKDARIQYGEDIPPIADLEKILTIGEKGSTKAFVQEDGKVRIFSVLGSKVLDTDGNWRQATDLNLTPAPQQVQTTTLDAIYGGMPDDLKKLVNGTVSETFKMGQDGQKLLSESTRARNVLESEAGIYEGLAGPLQTKVAQVGALFGIENPTLINTQEFALNRAARVGEIIKQYGAGTGLSDKDLAFASSQAGLGKDPSGVTFERETLIRMLDIEQQLARFMIDSSNKVRDYAVTNGLLTPAAAGLLELAGSLRPMPVESPASTSPTLDEFLSRARQANPNATDEELTAYWQSTYGQ